MLGTVGSGVLGTVGGGVLGTVGGGAVGTDGDGGFQRGGGRTLLAAAMERASWDAAMVT